MSFNSVVSTRTANIVPEKSHETKSSIVLLPQTIKEPKHVTLMRRHRKLCIFSFVVLILLMGTGFTLAVLFLMVPLSVSLANFLLNLRLGKIKK